MKQRKYKSLRACSLVLLTALGVTMLCGAAPAGDTTAAADQPEAAVAASTEPVLSYEEYFSQKRPLTESETSTNYGQYGQKEIKAYWLEWSSAQKDKAHELCVPSYKGNMLSEYALSGQMFFTPQGTVFCRTENGVTGLFLLTNSDIRLISYLPAGQTILNWDTDFYCSDYTMILTQNSGASADQTVYFLHTPTLTMQTIPVPAGQTIRQEEKWGNQMEAEMEWDNSVLFFVTQSTADPTQEYVYRYYIPEAKLEMVMDLAPVHALAEQHQGELSLRSYQSNEDLLFTINPLKDESHEADSEPFKAYLEQEIKNHPDDPELQDYLRWYIDYGLWRYQDYFIYFTYNIRTGEQNILYGERQYEAYEAQLKSEA